MKQYPSLAMPIVLSFLGACALLSACGGGGGSGEEPRFSTSAQAAETLAATIITPFRQSASASAPIDAQNETSSSSFTSSIAASGIDELIATATTNEHQAPAAVSEEAAAMSRIAAFSGATAASTHSAATTEQEVAAQSTAATNLARLQAAIADMNLAHEVVPAGVANNIGWKYKASVSMNTEPYGSAIGSWWNGTRYAQWRGILTWFVIYPAEGGNPATNSAVEINGLELWYLSARDKVWRRVQSGMLPSWNDAYEQNAIDTSTSGAYKSASVSSMSFAPMGSNMVHGGLGQAGTPWNASTDMADIDAICAVVRHRLVLKNSSGVDDRAIAKLGVQAGVDYYPWMGARVSDVGAAGYLPGAGSGRFLKATVNWRYSTLLLRSKRITEAQMVATPPPAFTY